MPRASPTVLFALTLALGSGLLFAVQPMAARMALPTLGGTPAVWNTSLVFFQAAVLAGYALAHVLARRMCPKPQVGLYLLLALAAGAGLPVAMGSGAGGDASGAPLWWLARNLAKEVGGPAVALAVAGPLLQHWHARMGSGREDPYFLYVASNVGSLGALIAYPVILERLLTLEEQARLWTIAYGLWAVLILACGALMLRNPGGQESTRTSGSEGPVPPSGASQWGVVLLWVALAAVPASLLQGCTLFLTTDVASVPLLWVVPLAIYLATFVCAFAARGARFVRAANRSLPFLAAAMLFVILARATQPVAVLMGLHLVFLLAAGLVCHGRLVALRPAPSRLTAFYLSLAVGGVLGGAFNALLAPLIFHTVAEYPLAIALACAALPLRGPGRPRAEGRRKWTMDFLSASAIAGATLAIAYLAGRWMADLPRVRDGLAFGIPAIACCALSDRPRRLALAVAAVFAAGLWIHDQQSGTRRVERNFFGITRVARDERLQVRQLVHGNTIHGRQFLDPERRHEPLSYYHRDGPLGHLFEDFNARQDAARVGVIGLGAGSMAAYARPGDDWTFFEIDPAIIRVALDTNGFTYLADCRAARTHIVTGDARLSLQAESDASYNLLVLDAFSSDAIPVHLLTREAFALYRSKLRHDGWLVAHISNRYLALEPVIAELARDAGWACRSADDMSENAAAGKEPSHWMVLAAGEQELGRLARQAPWLPAESQDRVSVWTDQRSSVFEAFDWR